LFFLTLVVHGELPLHQAGSLSGHCERTRKRNKPYHSALSVLCDCLASFEGATNVDFIGKKRVVKRSWGFSAGKRNVNYSETE